MTEGRKIEALIMANAASLFMAFAMGAFAGLMALVIFGWFVRECWRLATGGWDAWFNDFHPAAILLTLALICLTVFFSLMSIWFEDAKYRIEKEMEKRAKMKRKEEREERERKRRQEEERRNAQYAAHGYPMHPLDY